jgi:hypothetical protein
MEFALHTRAGRRLPDDVRLRLYFDFDRDGTYDEVAWSAPTQEIDPTLPAGRWLSVHGALPPGELDPARAAIGGIQIYQSYDLDESTSRLLVSADDLALDLRSGAELFDLAVMAVDGQGAYPAVGGRPVEDRLPDGLGTGESLTYDQLVLGCVAPLGQLTVPGGGSAGVDLAMACDPPAQEEPLTLLWSQASNPPGPEQLAQRAGKLSPLPRPGGHRVFLPYSYH